jgi:hypothetical protein
MIALEAKFWTSKYFDFDSLFPDTDGFDSFERALRWLGQMKRLQALIRNDRIAFHLDAKTQWRFSTHYLLDFAIFNIPHFRQNVREITMTEPDLGRLPLCYHITHLNIDVFHESISLPQIPLSFPLLEELSIHFTDLRYYGTINALSSLRSLKISVRQPLPFPVDLTPLHSASTLTHLNLASFTEITTEASPALSTFPNLTHLQWSPLYADSCDSISNLSSKLTTFLCYYCPIENAPLQNVLRMFRSESLSRLTTLTFHISLYDYQMYSSIEYRQYCYSILQTITASLPCIENFRAQIYIEEDWCQMFAKWRSLKSLHLLEVGRDNSYLERRIQLTDCIRKVFDGLEEKPVCYFGF